MSADHDTIRRSLSKAAQRLPTAARQLFRQFLADLPPAPLDERSDGRRKHSWHRKSKPRRPTRRAIVKRRSKQMEMFDADDIV